jgi:hypothetical protein
MPNIEKKVILIGHNIILRGIKNTEPLDHTYKHHPQYP